MNRPFGYVILSTLFTLACACQLSAQQSDLSSADGDADGKVTVAEFQEYASGKMPDFDKLAEFAQQVDADDNGEISADEFGNRMSILQSLAAAGNNPPKMEQPKKEQSDGSDSKTDDKVDNTDGPKQAFLELKKRVEDSQWEKAAELMTPKAQDDFCVERVLSAISLAKTELPIPLPGLQDSIDDLADVIEEHGFDKLDIDSASMFQMKMSIGGEEDEESDSDEEAEQDPAQSPKEKMAGVRKKILTQLDKDDKRWEIIGDIWEVQRTSPLNINAMTGSIQKVEMIDQQQAAIKIKLAPPAEQDGGPGVMIQIMSPPIVMSFAKKENRWLYNGLDEERTREEAKNFQQDMPEIPFGGGEQFNESDF